VTLSIGGKSLDRSRMMATDRKGKAEAGVPMTVDEPATALRGLLLRQNNGGRNMVLCLRRPSRRTNQIRTLPIRTLPI
jgi:hypothetical protein